MNRTQNGVVVGGIVLIGLMTAFPPWKAELHYDGRHQQNPLGYSFIVSPPAKFKELGDAWGAEIDVSRLALQILAVIAGVSALILVSRTAGTGYRSTKQSMGNDKE